MNPRNTLRTLIGFVMKELRQALRDPRMRVVLFVMPMMQMMVFGFAISSEVRNIRLTAQAAPGDHLINQVLQRAFASGWFVPAAQGQGDPFDWIQSGKADAVLVAPPGGAASALARGQARVQLLVDASNVVRAQAVESYMRSIFAQVLASEVDAAEGPLSFDVRILYNPSMESAVFMVPGVMSLILCVVTILLTSMSLAREREMGTLEMIISAPVKTWEVLLGKTIPYVLLGLIDIPLVMGIAVMVFHVPMRGAVWMLMFGGLVFICTTVAIGTLISTFAKSQQQAMMGGFIFLFVATLLSGILFPLENMPLPMVVISKLNPLTYFVSLMRNIMLKGGDHSVVLQNLAALVAMASASVWGAFRRFKPVLQ